MRLSYWRQKKEDEAELVSIKEAKNLLKKKGGYAWTEHYERDGTLFEVSEIKLDGNNSRFQYNTHL
jgi:hypothetical protein